MKNSSAPGKSLDAYPDAEPGSLPPPPPEGLPGEPDFAVEASPKADTPPEVAALEFVSTQDVLKLVPLKHPFRWNDKLVDAIMVKRLTLAEVGQLAEKIAADRTIDSFDVYAEMTMLPAAVLRGLICDDGEAVIDACAPFLPRLVAELLFVETSANGGNTH